MIPQLVNLINLSKLHKRAMSTGYKKYKLLILEKLKQMEYIQSYSVDKYKIIFLSADKLNKIMYVTPYKLSYNLKKLKEIKRKYDIMYQGHMLLNTSKGILNEITSVGGQIICYVY
jgi:ribosomal protein S8